MRQITGQRRAGGLALNSRRLTLNMTFHRASCQEAIWLCAPTCFQAPYEPTEKQDGSNDAGTPCYAWQSAERGNDAYLDDDGVLVLVKRLLLQVRTKLVIPPTDATSWVRPAGDPRSTRQLTSANNSCRCALECLRQHWTTFSLHVL